MKNNLFTYATSELSQDAFICWCANWHNDDSKPILREMSHKFISMISGITTISSVAVYRQFNKIDVLLIVNDTTAIIVEDKTFTSEHDNQINKYNQILQRLLAEKGFLEINDNRYMISAIQSVYLKTGNLYPEDESNANLDGVRIITRKDMLSLFGAYIQDSEIVCDYWNNLMELDHWYSECETQYINEQYDKAFASNYGQLFCIKDLFDGKMVGAFSDTDILIEPGSSFGRPFTWAWLWGRSNWYWIGYRLDCDENGFFLSLKQYRNYKSLDAREIIAKEKSEMFYFLRGEIQRLLIDTPLKAVIGGNRAGYNESELCKFYFRDNDIQLLRKHLICLAEQAIESYSDKHNINDLH